MFIHLLHPSVWLLPKALHCFAAWRHRRQKFARFIAYVANQLHLLLAVLDPKKTMYQTYLQCLQFPFWLEAALVHDSTLQGQNHIFKLPSNLVWSCQSPHASAIQIYKYIHSCTDILSTISRTRIKGKLARVINIRGKEFPSSCAWPESLTPIIHLQFPWDKKHNISIYRSIIYQYQRP